MVQNDIIMRSTEINKEFHFRIFLTCWIVDEMQLLQQDSASLFYSDGIFIGNYKIPLDIQNQIVY